MNQLKRLLHLHRTCLDKRVLHKYNSPQIHTDERVFKDFFEFVLSKISVYRRSSVVKN